MTWVERLQRAVKRGRFTPADENKAKAWATCAVGEAHRRAPRVVVFNLYDTPEDGVIEHEGFEFTKAVTQGRVGDAVTAYHAVTARARLLKRARS